ncbi:T1SS secreted agglutinin RTX [Vibrio maritimus]|uniref:T1SS secreted agglutinin RTX n=1 Tax=Vibrio maritimus TaxID=990268 RepID=A0A090T6C9_9VIBR|nr:T1SS secreted agglutinin RTX [Vibrio maritimus]
MFSVQVVDPLNGTAEQQIVITVSGTNDKPVISADSELAGVVVEAGNLDDGTPTTGVSEISGQLSATDVDSSQESLSWSLVDEADSTYGEFSITVDGVWTYKLANSSDDFSSAQRAAVDALKEGEVIQLFFKVQVTDDQGVRVEETVSVSINGTNDVPILDAELQTSGTVRESGSFEDGSEDTGTSSASGKLSATDVDSSNLIWSTVGDTANQYGSFSITEDGLWTFDLDNDSNEVEALDEGDEVPLTFTVQVQDEQGATVTQEVSILVKGTNDAPVAFPANETTDEDTAITRSVPEATDVDGTIESYVLKTDVPNGKGSLIFNSDGSYTFNPGDAFQSLTTNESENVVFTYVAVDDDGAESEPQTVTITVTGLNDNPESEDFEITVTNGSPTPVIFDTGEGDISGPGTDHISDIEDDRSTTDGKELSVVITELPIGGTLLYTENGVTREIVEADLHSDGVSTGTLFNPDNISYLADDDAQGFILGTKEIPTQSDLESTTDEFYNWGGEVDSNNRQLELGNGDVIGISGSGELTQYRGDVEENHVGHGLGIGGGQGINEGSY